MNKNIKYEYPQGTRTENVFIRLTPEEKRLLVTKAQQSGVSISAFVRLLLLNYTIGIKE